GGRDRGSDSAAVGGSRAEIEDAQQARHLRERRSAPRCLAQTHLDQVLRDRERVRVPVGGRVSRRGRPPFHRDARVPGGARGRIRVHLERGSLRLVNHRRYVVEDSGRPAEFPPEARRRIDRILSRYPTKQAALLPVLWVAQETWGWISRETAEEVARIVEVPFAHVDGVLTFYT